MPRSAHAQTFEATSLTACVIFVVRVYEASRLSFVTFACRCIFVVGMGGVASTLPLLKDHCVDLCLLQHFVLLRC